LRESDESASFKVTKGAPHVILSLCATTGKGEVVETKEDEALRKRVEEDVMTLGQRGIRCVAVAKHNDAAKGWYMLGLITFIDPPRPDTKQVWHESYSYCPNVFT
jgi:H+-transporting ATPase